MGNSERPLYKSGNMEVLPAIGKPKGTPRPAVFSRAVILDIPAEGKASRELFELRRVLEAMYPSSSQHELSLKSGRIFLGTKRIGVISNRKGDPGKIRIWMDDLVKSKIIFDPVFGNDFPKGRQTLSDILPFSSLSIMVSAEMYALLRFSEFCKFAALVSDGYVVRLEFHNAKRAKPVESFLLNTNLIGRYIDY